MQPKPLAANSNIVRIKYGGVHYEGGPMMHKRAEKPGTRGGQIPGKNPNFRENNRPQKELVDMVPLDGPITTQSLEVQLDKFHNQKNSIDINTAKQYQNQDRGRPIN